MELVAQFVGPLMGLPLFNKTGVSPMASPTKKSILQEGLGLWAAVFFVVLWSLWKERNVRVVSATASPISELEDLILLRLSWWVKGWAPNFPYSPDEVRRNPKCLQWHNMPHSMVPPRPLLQWCSPSMGQLKWNVDASFNPKNQRSAIRGVLRNAQGEFFPPMKIN